MTEIDDAFTKWFNELGSAMTFIEQPFYAGWNSRNAEVKDLRVALAEALSYIEYLSTKYGVKGNSNLVSGWEKLLLSKKQN